ncbi:hypothetical protein MCOR27_004954 [Pyricularia oryzae]|uniref:Serine aminopeptidase S33 domain-containing protein n=2 Tax=Pyricularia TaxID=48558 RepID=A0ABQ8NJM8_PYRGI|nr:hypothetical protein MCOR01_005790 [Pyricularia oryzae]KAI6298137.1 hypothetical protein MCOR33_005675 [Pyricularia grisea]KAH9435009.1 hypothetical protein MCOR02_003970 [Pyricularia oryzae]KAI6261771.1 hypothetical protein MCOR19_001983 [Pyricularia oryzae]KAI6279836.1 hypothetical protein MCOR27_004954 [Pyricularia oryzae]
MDLITNLWPERPSHSFVVLTTVAATFAIFITLRRYLYPRHPRIIPGPLKTVIPNLTKDEVAKLDYTPDYFPGARDVQTPYGSMRVYEFGPTTGRKILFIHGISTSCQTLTKLAYGLAARGHRVMLFDLFGRGFSDGVGDLPHDARLYVSQALCALASSPLSWMDGSTGGFDLAGYSLGGGVAVHFAASFPATVRSLILLAPAGMIRKESFGAVTRFVFTAGLVPERVLAALTRWKLQKPIASAAAKRPRQQQQQQKEGETKPLLTAANGAEGQEGSHGRAVGSEKAQRESNGTKHQHQHQHRASNPVSMATSEIQPPQAQESADRLERRVMRYVRWMLTNHAGFVPAFMSTIREAPLMGQDDAWSRVGTSRRAGTTCVILGQDDEIIDPEAYEEDALPLLGGRSQVRWRVFPAASHDFPMTHAEETLEELDAFWAEFPTAEESIA